MGNVTSSDFLRVSLQKFVSRGDVPLAFYASFLDTVLSNNINFAPTREGIVFNLGTS